MKRLIFILLIFLTSCEKDCDSSRYQVHDKKELGNNECEYTMWAYTECAIWQDRTSFKFTEKCSKYGLSQIIDAKELAQYR